MKKRWVVKLGTGILTRSNGILDGKQFAQLTQQILTLREQGIEIIVVTSGAIGAGMQAMKLSKRPQALSELQACATVGQIALMTEYQKRLSSQGYQAAQMLLTYWDIDSRNCYENAQRTLALLLKKKKFIPFINENDAISGEEIRVGDNDQLSAHVAVMVKADKLIILSNVDGLLDSKQQVIPEVKKIDKTVTCLATGTSNERSVGGMTTKLLAAQLAARCGVETIIANGRNPKILSQIAQNKFVGTRFRLI
ncbi:MAG: glutamate 5-kinase [Verrucomicrobiae bacterium]|nr:glutamate 5-kinase [Verrucomicrobiae bacterium]